MKGASSTTNNRKPPQGGSSTAPTIKAAIPHDLLAHAIGKKLSADALKPGEYHVHGTATLEIDAIISKSEPVETYPDFKPGALVVLAIVMEECKVRQARIMELAERVLTEAVSGDSMPKSLDSVIVAAARAKEAFRAGKTKGEKEGSTKVAGTVEIVGFQEK